MDDDVAQLTDQMKRLEAVPRDEADQAEGSAPSTPTNLSTTKDAAGSVSTPKASLSRLSKNQSGESNVVNPIRRYSSTSKLLGQLIIGSLNCRGFKGDDQQQKLVRLLEGLDHTPDIIALSETYISEFGKSIPPAKGEKGEYLLFSSSVGSYSGTGFLIRENLKHCILTFKSESDRLSYLDLIVGKQFVRVVSVYLPASTEVEGGRRSAYRDLMNNIRFLIPEKALCVIAGDWNAEIGVYQEFDGTYIGSEVDLSNVNAKRKRNWPGKRLVNFCRINELYIANRFTRIEQHRYTHHLKGAAAKNDKEIDYILCADDNAAGTFSIIHSIFTSNSQSDAGDDQFSTDHRMICATFSLKFLKTAIPSDGHMGYGMELSFLLEWAVVTQNQIICIRLELEENHAKSFREKWSGALVGVNIGVGRFSLYECNGVLLILSRGEEEANKILQEEYLRPEQITYISTYDVQLNTIAERKASIDFAGKVLSLDLEKFTAEEESTTEEKWNYLPTFRVTVISIVRDIMSNDKKFRSPTPLFSLLYHVRHCWLELIAEKKFWEKTLEMCKIMKNHISQIDTDSTKPKLLPPTNLPFPQEMIPKFSFMMLMKFTNTTTPISVRDLLKHKWSTSECEFLLNDTELLIHLDKQIMVKGAINHVEARHAQSVEFIRICQDKWNDWEKNWKFPLKTQLSTYFEFKNLFFQFKSSSEIFCKILIENFNQVENKEKLANTVQIEERVKFYVVNIRNPLMSRLLLVPLTPFDLAKISETETEILQVVLNPSSSMTSDLYEMAGMEDFRLVYYRTKWNLVANETIRNYLRYISESNVWMEDIRWYGKDTWIEISKNPEAWKLALDIYLEVNVNPIDLNDAHLGVPRSDR